MLAPGGEMEEPSLLTEMGLSSLSMYQDFVSALREESGLAIDFRRSGAIELAFTEEEAIALDARALRQAAVGIASQALRYPRAAHARLFPADAQVDPRHVVAALRLACCRRGVRIIEHEPVTEILGNGTGVKTASATYEDDGVLIAAGAWSSALAVPFRQPEARPIRGHLISYSLQPGVLDTILRHQNTYLLQRTSGMLIAGATTEEAGFNRRVDEDAVTGIRKRASFLLQQLESLDPADRWTGFRPRIDSDVPAICRIENTRIWTAYGHYRNGILLAPDTADRIVRSIAQS